MIAGDDGPVGTKEIDAVAILPGAAAAGTDACNAIALNQRIVIRLGPAMHENAAIAAIADGVGGNRKARAFDGIKRIGKRAGKAGTLDPPAAAFQLNASLA